MKFRLPATILAIMFSNLIFAQSGGKDMVRLQNGTSYRGKILNVSEDCNITFSIKEEAVMVIPTNEVASVDTDREFPQLMECLGEVSIVEQFDMDTDGWYGSGMVLFLPSSSENRFGETEGYLGTGIEVSIGKQFWERVGLGLGAGFNNVSPGGEMIFPVYLESRTYLFNTKKVYFTGRIGIAFPRGSNENPTITSSSPGLLFHPAIGFRFNAEKEQQTFIEFGWRYASATYDGILTDGDLFSIQEKYRRISLSFGLLLWK